MSEPQTSSDLPAVDPEWDAHMRSGQEIGPDHYIRREYLTPDGKRITYPADRQPPDGSVFIGLTENHKTPEGKWCGGWIAFKNVPNSTQGTHEARHELISADPLTVAPSLGCRQCPSHGFIREGRWVDA